MSLKQGFQLSEYVITPKFLGKGSYGEVYMGYHAETKQRLAVKVMLAKDSKIPVKIMKNEVSLLQKVRSHNIVKFFDVKKNKDHDHFIILQYCQSDLKKEIEKQYSGGQYIEEAEIIEILKQICNGYKVLYQNKIIHRDIKPENILMKKGVYKIADFGFGRFVSDPDDISMKTLLGSPIYTAPQILQNKGYSAKCDIWSLGILLFQLLYYRHPFNIQTTQELRAIIPKKKVIIPNDPQRSQTVRNLLESMLQIDECNRIDWPDLFCHEILAGFEQLGAQEMAAIHLVQKYLRFEKNICHLLNKITEYFAVFQNLIQSRVYLIGMLALSSYILHLNKILVQCFFIKDPPHQTIDENSWDLYKQTLSYWKLLKQVKLTQSSLQLFLQQLKPDMLSEIKYLDNKIKPLVQCCLNRETFGENVFEGMIDWIVTELKSQKIAEVMINSLNIAKNPKIYFNIDTDFEQVEEDMNVQFRSLEFMS